MTVRTSSNHSLANRCGHAPCAQRPDCCDPRPRAAGRERQRAQACYRPSQMLSSGDEHIGTANLEGYSLQELGPEALEAVECHLLLCAACRDRLAEIQPFNTVHSTQNGPFYLRITQLRDGSFAARYWGCQIGGESRHGN